MAGVRDRPFPVQGDGWRSPTACSWADAERAYAAYSAKYYGGGEPSQTLERLAERGGFSRGEMDDFAPGWSEVGA